MTEPDTHFSTDLSGIDWEDAFTNAAYIPDGEAFPTAWQAKAAAFRATARGKLDIAYGKTPRERMDLFLPEATAHGLVVFIHGGYWKAFDKSYWSHLATGPLAHGWAVAFPSYTLAPDARIGQITVQIGRAITHAAGLAAGPIALAGHSAGGHLAARMACANTPLPDNVADRIKSVVPISGVHDLRPLQRHSMNATLRLDAKEAISESTALHSPRPGISATAWVGALERPEFLRQSALLAEAWGASLIAEPGRHHFNVIDGLSGPDHPLTRNLLAGRSSP